VLRTAQKAADLIGDGLYGVDLQETAAGPVVIEVNDNPSLDSDVEDQVLGEELYLRLIGEFVERLDRRGARKK
jgi:glutathione synthase/RimK-type ligase-like ATP-grasp enzyme